MNARRHSVPGFIGRHCSLVAATLLWAGSLQAAEGIDCEALSTLNAGQYDSGFETLRALAIDTNNKLCLSMLNIGESRAEQVQNTLLDFSAAAKQEVRKSFDDADFSMLEDQFDFFEARIGDIGETIDDTRLDQLRAGGVMDAEFYFSTNPARSQVPAALDDKCTSVEGSSKRYNDCKGALQDVGRAFNAYRYAYDQYRYDQNIAELNVLSQSWERYLDESRPQTLLDVLATTWFNRGYFKQNKLLPPPPRQYFLLRPQVVYEYADAAKGDRQRLAIALEWAGVNWWDSRIPFGVSAVSIVSDDESVDSVAHGLLFTVDNKYSVGWTRRGDADGIFVTLDLLKLVQDKQQTFEQYKDRF